MFEYDNQSEIDKAKEIIQSIDPHLRLDRFTLKYGTCTVTEVGLSLPLKGNKALIQKLESVGFKQGFISKGRSSSDSYWNLSTHYTMEISMKANLSDLLNRGGTSES